MKKNETKNNCKLSLVKREIDGAEFEFLELKADTISGEPITFFIDIRVKDRTRKAKLYYKVKKNVIDLYE